MFFTSALFAKITMSFSVTMRNKTLKGLLFPGIFQLFIIRGKSLLSFEWLIHDSWDLSLNLD